MPNAGENHRKVSNIELMTEPRKPHRATIVDVANAAGVSKSSVSLALRGDSGVSEQTRDHILSVATELGYHSNIWARSLVQGSVGLIGVLLTDLKNEYHTDIVAGIEDAAEASGRRVIIANGRREPERLSQQMTSLIELRCDGIAVVSAHTPYDALELAAQTTRIVVVGRPGAIPPRVSNIHNNDESGARLAVEHLISQGRTRIAFLQKSQAASSIARRDAYTATMRAAGLEPVVIQRDELHRLEGFDGVFASNDQTAALALGWAHDVGVKVPDDMAIIGYDDTEFAQILRPQLSSIGQPRFEMGQRACEILMMDDAAPDDIPIREVFEPTLVVRESTRRQG